MARSKILHGDCLSRLKTLPPNSVDSLVCDPPAGISFIGKDWDHHKGGRDEWIAWLESVMRECLRVLKPGAHGLVWALPRTSHWTATALENAGFEVRDVVTHIFGSGFPKSLDVSKAIDKAAGHERALAPRIEVGGSARRGDCTKGWKNSSNNGLSSDKTPATEAAKRWQGFGTALKPASEHWILVRKPISEKTVAANVLRWGTGALAIDASRIGFASSQDKAAAAAAAQRLCRDHNKNRTWYGRFENGPASLQPYLDGMNKGRWPANLILGDEALLGEYSRYFYCAKPSRRERDLGLEKAPKAQIAGSSKNGKLDPVSARFLSQPMANTHCTVKPITLMRYLIRMVTPPGGLTLDPFCGSGTTGCAARKEGLRFLGIEQSAEYVAISKARIRAHEECA